MSRFKDAVQADIKAVFINSDEFADIHNINGDDVKCVIDRDIMEERNLRSYAEFAEGVYNAQIRIYVALDDLPHRPVKGEMLRLDDELYLVNECAEDMGMLEITVEANAT